MYETLGSVIGRRYIKIFLTINDWEQINTSRMAFASNVSFDQF